MLVEEQPGSVVMSRRDGLNCGAANIPNWLERGGTTMAVPLFILISFPLSNMTRVLSKHWRITATQDGERSRFIFTTGTQTRIQRKIRASY